MGYSFLICDASIVHGMDLETEDGNLVVSDIFSMLETFKTLLIFILIAIISTLFSCSITSQ